MEPQATMRISRHPFFLVGYWDGHFKTSAPQDAAIYASELKPGLYAIVKLTDGATRFLVRGQFYSTLKAARAA